MALMLLATSQAHAIPVVLAAAAGAAGAMITAGSMAITGAVIGQAILGAVLAGASMLLQQKPKSVSGQMSGTTVTGYGANNPKRIIYGQTKVGGTIFFQHSTGNNNEYLHICVAFAGHKISSYDKIWFDDYLLTLDANGNAQTGVDSTGKTVDYTGLATVYKHMGDDNQAADANLITAAPDKWDSTCMACGNAYLYIKLKYNSSVFSNGLPAVTALISGKPVYDPRNSTTAFSSNPALCLRDFLTDARYGLCADTATEIDDTTFIAAANHCDEIVNKSDGTTEKRYVCNGTLDSSTGPEQMIANLRMSMAGLCPYVGGKFRAFAGVWRTPESGGLSEKDCIDKMQIQSALQRQDLFNGVKGTYISPNNQYQATDFPAIYSNIYMAADGGERLWQDITLPFTQSPSMAQRISKIMLLQTRQPTTVSLSCPLSAIRFTVGDIIPLSLARMGWVNKYFEIQDLKLGTSTTSGSAPVPVIKMTLRETCSAVYDWSTNDESPAPLSVKTNLPSGKSIPPPTNVGISSGTNDLYVRPDGTVISRAHLTWTPSAWGTVQDGGCYVIQYKPSNQSNWHEWSKPAGYAIEEYVSDVQDGAQYDFRIAAVSVLGVYSTWVTLTNYTIIGKTAAPNPPTNFNLVVQPDGTRQFSWIKPTDPDFAGCLVGYSTNLSAIFSQMSLLNNGGIVANPYETNQLAAGTYRFGIISVDTSGNQSTPVYLAAMTIGSPRIAGAIAIYNPNLSGWQGTITNGAARSDGWIEPTTTQTWTALPATWDAWTNWLSNYNTPITYVSQVYDLGSILAFTPLVTANCQGTPTYQIKTSNDNSTWTGWQGVNATYTARYFQIQTQVASANSLPPIIFSEQIIASGNPKSETVTNLTSATVSTRTSTGVFTVPLMKTYNLITSVQVIFVGNYPGYTFNVVNKSVSGPLINLFNGSNVLADAVVDVIVTGL